jgi:hypothetical protein
MSDMAGVEDDEVGVVAVVDRAQALSAEQLGHALGIVDVHLAAERLDEEGLGLGHAALIVGKARI